jgi:hypothetical protein
MHFEVWRLNAAPIPLTTKPSTVLVGAPRRARWAKTLCMVASRGYIYIMQHGLYFDIRNITHI